MCSGDNCLHLFPNSLRNFTSGIFDDTDVAVFWILENVLDTSTKQEE